MRRSSSDLKALAQTGPERTMGASCCCCLLIFICSFILTLVITALLNPYSVLSIITCQIMIYIVSLFISLFQAGYMKLLLNMNRKEPFSLKDLISPFTPAAGQIPDCKSDPASGRSASFPSFICIKLPHQRHDLFVFLSGRFSDNGSGWTYPLPVLRTVQLSASG